MRRARRRLYRPRRGRVLDFLPSGNPLDKHPEHRSKPFIQALDEDRFKLLEYNAKFGSSFSIGEKVVFVPLDQRLLNKYYLIGYEDLTKVAQDSLLDVLIQLVNEMEKVFVQFFNIAEPITLRLHAIELLPGIGKRHLQQILQARRQKPFESFEDLEKRGGLKSPQRIIAERIIKEIQGGEKYYLFAEPPPGSKGLYLNYMARLRALVGLDKGSASESGSEAQ